MSRRADGQASKSKGASRQGAGKQGLGRAGDAMESDEQVWAASRAGGNASRGFHYQYMVGAWLCGRVLTGDLVVDRVVPEGFEDMSCETLVPIQVQVKSRQERIGDFGVATVADFVMKMVQTMAKRRASSERMVLVLERPVVGAETGPWEETLADLAVDNPVRTAVAAALSGAGHSDDEVGSILAAVSVVVLPWHEAAEQTADMVLTRVDVPRAAAGPMVSALRDAVATCIDTNTSPNYADRSGLTRTSVERIVTEVGGLVDVAALEEALTSGACEPVDFGTPLHTVRFYEGVDVQPGHIVAGLPAPRPTVTGTVVDAIEENGVALVSGPSGVGKSTVMWVAAYVTRHVLWYRVRRLEGADVEPLARLVLAAKPTARTPVGLVVDAVGQSGARAWDALVLRLEGVAGVKLLGSARNEELLPLRTLPRAVLVPVGLDEEVARQIHQGLLQRGATTLPHWQDAYDKAGGLTLEFTYLLTRGQRLPDVVADQVRARTHDNRWTELAIIAAVATAHQWGAVVGLRAVQRIVGGDDGRFRQALARLADEHLVHQQGTVLTGMHQLRSAALATAVHDQPPPVLADTVRSLLPALDDAVLAPFIVGALSAHPYLDDIVVDHLVDRLPSITSPTTWAQAMHTLRIVEFIRTAQAWAEIARRHVAPALYQVLLSFVIAGIEPLRSTRPEIVAAMAEIAELPPRPSSLRDRVLAGLDDQTVAAAIAACTCKDDTVHLLAALVDTRAVNWDPVAESLRSDPALAVVLRGMPIQDLAEVLATAKTTSAAVAAALAAAAGGHDRLIHDIYRETPWLIGLDQSDQDGAVVVSARLLEASRELHGDIGKAVTALGELLAFCFVDSQVIEVSTVGPGSAAVPEEDLPAAQRMASDNFLTPAAKSWNLVTMRIALQAAGTSDPTLRVQQVHDLLPDLRSYLDRITRMLLTGSRIPEVVPQSARLSELADHLMVAFSDDAVGLAPGQSAPNESDAVHSLASGIVHTLTRLLLKGPASWSSLASHINDNLRRYVAKIRETERWYLIGVEAPEELDRIDTLLVDLHAVLAEYAWGDGPAAVRAQGRGKPGNPLRAAADVARRTAGKRALARKQRFQAALRRHNVQASFIDRSPENAKGSDWPPTRTMLAVAVQAVTDWIHASNTITQLLQQNVIKASDLGREPLAIARLSDRPISLTARKVLTTKLAPHLDDLVQDWGQALGEPFATPLPDLFIRFVKSLYAVSVLRTLHACRPEEHGNETDIRNHADLLKHTLAELRSFPGDRVVAAITDSVQPLLAEPQSELDDSSASLASRTLAVKMADPTSEIHNEVNGLELLALAWSISPTSADQWLSTVCSE